MKKIPVSHDLLVEVLTHTITQAAVEVPPDVREKLQSMRAAEQEPRARLHYDVILENCRIAEEEHRLACPDTGFVLYYIRIGDGIRIEGGTSSIYDAAREAAAAATTAARLRPTMVHPITRKNPGTNVGPFIPKVELLFDPDIDYIEITAVPKGGGSEIFGTFYRMLYPADGLEGVIAFILDCVGRSTYAGGTCPPNVVGIGIGGTADLCMKLAKEAAVLRPVGDRHPEKQISDLERRLLAEIDAAGIGPMGMGGTTGAMDVHIEYAVTHTAALPVGYNAQCSLCRRKTARIAADGEVTHPGQPSWFSRRREMVV